jgi:hypothetical protein
MRFDASICKQGGLRTLTTVAGSGGKPDAGGSQAAEQQSWQNPNDDAAGIRESIRKLLELQAEVLETDTRARRRRQSPALRIMFSADDLLILLENKRFPFEIVSKVVSIGPKLRHLSSQKGEPTRWDIRENLRFLDQEVGLRSHQLPSCVNKYPLVLIHRVSSMRTTVAFLRRILCFGAHEASELVCAQPSILGASTATKLFPILIFLLRDLKVSMAEVRHIVSNKPQVLLPAATHFTTFAPQPSNIDSHLMRADARV